MIKKNSLISRINIYHKLGYPYNVHRTSGNPHYVRPFLVSCGHPMDHLFHTFFGDPKLEIRWRLSVGLTVKRIYTERPLDNRS